MAAFVRQLAVLSMLWAFCELLMPEGKQRQMVRLTAGVLVMAALVSALNGLLGGASVIEWPARAVMAEGGPPQSPERYVVQAAANQARSYCERMAARAGYDGEAAVYLRQDGSLERVELTLTAVAPLIDAQTLADELTRALGTEPSRVHVAMADADAIESGAATERSGTAAAAGSGASSP